MVLEAMGVRPVLLRCAVVLCCLFATNAPMRLCCSPTRPSGPTPQPAPAWRRIHRRPACARQEREGLLTRNEEDGGLIYVEGDLRVADLREELEALQLRLFEEPVRRPGPRPNSAQGGRQAGRPAGALGVAWQPPGNC